jgi:hypothetical protein
VKESEGSGGLSAGVVGVKEYRAGSALQLSITIVEGHDNSDEMRRSSERRLRVQVL